MKITIVSSASVQNPEYLDLAHEVGAFLASESFDLVVGGISGSMMKIIYEEFTKRKNCVVCNTLSCYQNDLICDNTVLYDQTFDRLKGIYNQTDQIIVLPGGTGSLTELFGVLEEIRTQDQQKRIIILNYHNFYTPILNFIDQLIDQGFNQPDIKNYLIIVNTIEELKEKVSG